jgi:hypothetical protein
MALTGVTTTNKKIWTCFAENFHNISKKKSTKDEKLKFYDFLNSGQKICRHL